jgi:glycosyltransferase involved in cell wall biosynthesis
MNGCVDVIIPTWNEENWLPRLLGCLRHSPIVSSIVVADNGSQDATRQIAEAHGCRVVPGGKPAQARNTGAAYASAEILLFVDADTILPLGFLDELPALLRNPSLAAVYFRNLPLSERRLPRIIAFVADRYFSLLSRFDIAQGVATAIAVRTAVFRISGGFPENVEVGEDAYFLRCLSRIGTVQYVRTLPVYTSSRRLRLDGRMIYIIKLLLWTALRLLHLKVSLLNYNWQQYPAEFAILEDDILR